MMDNTEEGPEAAQTVLFRPSKKRKIYRQRANEDDPSSPTTPIPNATIETLVSAPSAAAAEYGRNAMDSDEGEVEGAQVSMAEILRLRKLRKHRIGGVEFRVAAPVGGSTDADSLALVHRDEAQRQEEEVSGSGVVRRFAKQTGMVGDVDKHMMAYIDSELAKRRQPVSTNSANLSDAKNLASNSDIEADNAEKNSKELQRQPATLGKLMEIDLGNETRAKNIARTEQARRRMDGEDVEEDDAAAGPTKKVRLGRDGKPWRSRKRRTSEDIKRDQLVDEVLRENRLELYEPPPPARSTSPGDSDADDRLAEAFRREFMDAVSARQRKKPVAPPPTRGPGGKKEEEALKGPKLGGSRSARAAMREVMLKAAAGKK